MQLPVQLRRRKRDTHKGDYGHVFVVGASPGLTGAVCMCAQGSLRSGAGLVTVGVPGELNHIFEIKLTEAMSVPLPESRQGGLSEVAYRGISRFIKKADVVVAGCGAGREPGTQKLFRRLIRTIPIPLLVDADGLYALSSDIRLLKARRGKQLVLTPHMGEFSRLTGKNDAFVRAHRKELAKAFALKYNLVLVLKGKNTLVTDGERLFENSTGNPGMATAGAGDVLAGVISAFMGQGLCDYDAARYGVYIHGLAGDLAARQKGVISLIATDIIDHLPLAFLKTKRGRLKPT